MRIAKYHELIQIDPKLQMDNFKIVLERFPTCSSAGAALDGSYKAALRLGTTKDWTAWVCKILDTQRSAGRLQYSAAMTASRYGVIDPCFAKAARQARALGIGGAFLDTLAIKLEGGVVPSKKSATAPR